MVIFVDSSGMGLKKSIFKDLANIVCSTVDRRGGNNIALTVGLPNVGELGALRRCCLPSGRGMCGKGGRSE